MKTCCTVGMLMGDAWMCLPALVDLCRRESVQLISGSYALPVWEWAAAHVEGADYIIVGVIEDPNRDGHPFQPKLGFPSINRALETIRRKYPDALGYAEIGNAYTRDDAPEVPRIPKLLYPALKLKDLNVREGEAVVVQPVSTHAWKNCNLAIGSLTLSDPVEVVGLPEEFSKPGWNFIEGFFNQVKAVLEAKAFIGVLSSFTNLAALFGKQQIIVSFTDDVPIVNPNARILVRPSLATLQKACRELGVSPELAVSSARKPLFSLIHPSARPGKWQSILNAWLDANEAGNFEYILVCDKRWGFEQLPVNRMEGFRAVWNTGRRCYVDAVNIGAQYATGDVLIVAADDQFPCDHWDLKIAEILADSGKEVVEVSTGTPKEHERGILVLPILTRERYDRLGYLLYPEYESMFADNDFCEMARRDDQVADARNLFFPHKHPFFDATLQIDEALKAQNRPEAYQLGAAVLAKRRADNFGGPRKRIDVCMLGERFSLRWVSSLFRSLIWLQTKYDLVFHMGYSTNVYAARTALVSEVKQSSEGDYVLWIDDDNPIEPEHLAHLLSDLEGVPGIDVICGWCALGADHYTDTFGESSVGYFKDGHRQAPLSAKQVEQSSGLLTIDWTGLPLVLMRRAVLDKFEKPFAPMPNERSAYGFDSEDLSFSRRLKEAGMNLAVDPRVKVPHLKLRDVNISPATAGSLKGEK